MVVVANSQRRRAGARGGPCQDRDVSAWWLSRKERANDQATSSIKDGFRRPCTLQASVEQLPLRVHAAEAVPLAEELEKIRAGRRYGPQPLAEILLIVLARL
jgi:hypothetical protein